MLNSFFKDKFPFCYDYFSTLLNLVKNNQRDFPQGIIFEGSDTKTQYLFTLELARILNCDNYLNPNCDCINCRWIKSYTHPGVNIVSQIHFKGEDDDTKTIISVKQALLIENTLSLSSDYHRFFIFFSSKEKQNFNQDYSDFKTLGYDDNISYAIEPLNNQTFHPTTLNALLKSVEEPPKKTTFVFLTKSKEDILSTIVSRCLVFKLASNKNASGFCNRGIFEDYLNLTFENAFDFSQKLKDCAINQQKDSSEILDEFLLYLKELLKNNIKNDDSYNKILNDVKIVSYSIKQLNANMSDKNTLDTMALRLVRGY